MIDDRSHFTAMQDRSENRLSSLLHRLLMYIFLPDVIEISSSGHRASIVMDVMFFESMNIHDLFCINIIIVCRPRFCSPRAFGVGGITSELFEIFEWNFPIISYCF